MCPIQQAPLEIVTLAQQGHCDQACTSVQACDSKNTAHFHFRIVQEVCLCNVSVILKNKLDPDLEFRILVGCFGL